MSNENWYWSRYKDIPASGDNPVWYNKVIHNVQNEWVWKKNERCVIALHYSDYFKSWHHIHSCGPDNENSFTGSIPQSMGIATKEDAMRLIQAAFSGPVRWIRDIEKIDYSQEPQPTISTL